MKSLWKKLIPVFIWNMCRETWYAVQKLPKTPLVRGINRSLLKVTLRFMVIDAQIVKIFNNYGLNVSSMSDFYSPLPSLTSLEKNSNRWFKPSTLYGVKYDLHRMNEKLISLVEDYNEEYKDLCESSDFKRQYGPGFPFLDSLLLYCMIRDIKPRKYIEIGSGASTFCCSLAARENSRISLPVYITCIDPYPYNNLYEIPNIKIINKEVQNVEISFFDQLEAGDILFIDSTHIVKIDGDVPYIYLEIIPRLKKGVIIHIHDIHFPYNIPYPPQYYIFGKKRPVFWNEAMILQAFLCYNDIYKIIMSLPLLRYFCEEELQKNIKNYKPLEQNSPYTHAGSMWIEKG